MFIIQLFGGIGNQMFQLALYKNFELSNKKVLIDDLSFKPSWKIEQIKINKIFPNISYNAADKEIIELLSDFRDSRLHRLRRKYLFKKNSHIREPKFTFNYFIYLLEGDYYLEGFWQSEKYFKHISDEIIKLFLFPDIKGEKNIELSKKIISENSVSIHVRKGEDYKRILNEGICNKNYYERSIELISNKVNNPKFYIFSDNVIWCKENLSFIDAKIIDWNPKDGPLCYLDMQLMSLCKHNIIANSSYSWWGAWLNKNPDKIVVGPKRWFNSSDPKFDTRDLIPESWYKL